MCTFEGKGGVGCNPRYIVEELHKRSSKYEFVWFVNDMGKDFPPYVRKVPNTLWSRAFWLSTSKIWIDNYRKPYGTCKRKGQYYINTWHGTIGFKSMGLWRGEAFSKMAYLVSRNDSKMIDRLVIDSDWCVEVDPKGIVYEGNFLRAGAPRCDVLYGNRVKQRARFRQQYGLDDGIRIVMYAPTFREKSEAGKRSVYSGSWTLDFKRLLHSLETRFGGKWYLGLRLHPQVAGHESGSFSEQVIDLSKADDMNEILAAMDVFVTDYSSAAMDAGFARIPVFLYIDDIEQYLHERGSLLWNFSENSHVPVTNNKEMTPGIDTVLPYPVARNNEELEKNILCFKEETYASRTKSFEEAVGLVFDGKASSRVADKVEEYIWK